jgi:hypothetical protein
MDGEAQMKDNPQAFPSFERLELLRSGSIGPEVKETIWIDGRGMTLRDYFAAKAMQGMLSCEEPYFSEKHVKVNTPGLYAELAYDFADAMLEARKK